ncbi:MAG TPA: mycothiol system anti-sigma-R factor [Acidimicrobiales bacterium]|nr:mycothiol system anti-sigma-R factor [Acidimicrobiales bacterium]
MTDPTRMTDPCEEALHVLYRFLDGELTDHRRVLISAHLDTCTTCLGAYDFEVELRQVIVSRVQDRVPEELRLRIARLMETDEV